MTADVDGVKITVLDKKEFYEPIEGGQYFHMLYTDEVLKDNGYIHAQYSRQKSFNFASQK